MSTARVVAKATKVAWQRDVARLYYHMLCQLHLERRWIPIEELALAGEEFLSLFRARFVDRTFRCSMLDDGPDDMASPRLCWPGRRQRFRPPLHADPSRLGFR